MLGEVLIRQAIPEDAEALTAYMHRLVNEPHNNITLDPGQWTMTIEEERAFLKANASSAHRYFVVADLSGLIVGCANIRRSEHVPLRHAASLGISVDADHRRRGIGRALMEALLAWARVHDICRVELKVFTRNTAAIALYKRLGFVEEGLHRKAALKQGVWCDDLTMALFL